ncbi:Ribonuclease Z 1 [Cucumispora dikerogammari]|nr:Ribonuclease Z 1 [Cucumispora dikerogammari]
MHSFINNSTVSQKSLLFKIQNHLFMFGIPDGVQKLFNEKKKSLKSVTHFIITERKDLLPLIGICHSLFEMDAEINVLHNFLNEVEIETLNSSILPSKVKFHSEISNDFCRIIKKESGYLIELKKVRGKFQMEKLLKLAPLFPKNKISQLVDGTNVLHDGVLYKTSQFVSKKKAKPVYILMGNVPSITKQLLRVFNTCSIVFCFDSDSHAKILQTEEISANIFYIQNQNYISPSILKFREVTNKFDSRMLKPQSFPVNETLDLIPGGHILNTFIDFNKDTHKYTANTNCLFVNKYILFLGTGSAKPTKYRNVSGCLVNIKNKVILLDCGEGTCNQIYSAYGNLDILTNLSLIIISHAHADHFLGMFKIIDHVYSFRNEKVNIVGPHNIKKYIEFFGYQEKINFFEADGKFNQTIEGMKIKSCKVDHRIYANAYVLNISGFKLSFSGDCRPSEEFAKMATNSDIMIHEATFNDDMQEDAIRTKHSTYSEALNVFKQSKSRKLFLTHFSQRYNMTVDFVLKSKHVIIAYDLLLYNFKSMDSKGLQAHIIKNFPKT